MVYKTKHELFNTEIVDDFWDLSKYDKVGGAIVSQSGLEPGESTQPPIVYATPSLQYLRQHLSSILLGALPYVSFLIIYGLNPYLHVLLVAHDAEHAYLHNVTSWEGHVMPISVHKLISSYYHPLLDFICIIPYMMHYVIPVLFPVYLAFTCRMDCIGKFYRLVGLSMWVHYLIWYLLPTFPPWATHSLSLANQPISIATAGPDVIINSATGAMFDLRHKEGAAFSRVDAMMGNKFFYKMFYNNPVPFGAFPSGHVTWPMCIYMIGPPGGRSRFIFYVIWMTWATLYSCHHYLFDALASVCLVLTVSSAIDWWTSPECAIYAAFLKRVLKRQRATQDSPGKDATHLMNGKYPRKEDVLTLV